MGSLSSMEGGSMAGGILTGGVTQGVGGDSIVLWDGRGRVEDRGGLGGGNDGGMDESSLI